VLDILEISGTWAMPSGPRWARWLSSYGAGWPFGKLLLTKSEIVLSMRGPLLLVYPRHRLEIPLAELVSVGQVRGGWAIWRHNALRFRTKSPSTDRAEFASTPGRIRRLEALLAQRGVTVES